jgi:carbamoyltransferase
MKTVLGVRFGHDAAACLVVDGQIVADIAEERLTRKKNDGSFPACAVRFCLDYAGVDSRELDALAVASEYLAPDFRDFFPGLEVPAAAGNQRRSWRGMIGRRPLQPARRNPLPVYMDRFPVLPRCKLVQVEHHRAHAASAYFTAGLDFSQRALVVVLDGMGDHSSVSLWRGENNRLERLTEWDVTGSLGRFYSAATEALGWRHGSDEWKLMGLAPYGTPAQGLLDGFYPVFNNGELVKPCNYERVLRYPDHGTFHYHMEEAEELRQCLGRASREDFAAEAQRVVEQQAMALLLPWLQREGTRVLCCAGGFFLNVKLNGLLWRSGALDEHWVYPNPGDSGLAVGAALSAYYDSNANEPPRRLQHLYHGPEFSNDEIQKALDGRHIPYTKPDNLPKQVAHLLSENRIVGWFQGRMESGPRALGGRSILMSPLRAENKDIINASVKYREAFRPFCPSMLDEARDDYLVSARSEPFMVTAFDAAAERRQRIPAVVHVDGSLRPQTVTREAHPRYHTLIQEFGRLTGENVVLNTSFNVKGEPIVCSPSDAIKCFFDTGLEYLAIGDFLVAKPGLA